MKLKFPIYLIAVSSFLSLGGCSKQEEPMPVASPAPTSSIPRENTTNGFESTSGAIKDTISSNVTSAVNTAGSTNVPETAVTNVSVTNILSAEAATQSSAAGIIERVRGLVAEKKYTEALTALSELSSTEVTVEQQNLITQLKTQISNALAAKAGNDGLKSVGGLLKK